MLRPKSNANDARGNAAKKMRKRPNSFSGHGSTTTLFVLRQHAPDQHDLEQRAVFVEGIARVGNSRRSLYLVKINLTIGLPFINFGGAQ